MPAQVKLLPYEDKPGKGWAVKKAIEAADGDYVLFMDADLSTDLHAFDTIKPDSANTTPSSAPATLKARW
jgi:hypothetical protein